MSIHQLPSDGISVACLLFPHEWSEPLTISHRRPMRITDGLSGREGRRPKSEVGLNSIKVHLVLKGDQAQAFRQMLAALEDGWVGIPIWRDRLLGSEWSSRVYNPQRLINLTDPVIVAAGSSLNAEDEYAPLVVGHIDELPNLPADTEDMAAFSFTLTEDSPWEFRIGVNAAVDPDVWPSALRPAWTSSPKEEPITGVSYRQVGDMRERVAEGTEQAFRWSQEAQFVLKSANDVALLLGFWEACRGELKAFDQPWWFRPGTSAPEAPHETKARFASSTLTITYESAEVATATITVVQVPWEILGTVDEVPEQPPRFYLYRFSHALPSPQVYRFTSWARALTRGGDVYASAPLVHRSLTEALDGRSNSVELDSFVFSGNPLMLLHPYHLEAPLTLEIFEGESDPLDPDSASLIWVGEVKRANPEGPRLKATALRFGGLLDRPVPGVLVGETCNTRIFHPRCGLSKAAFAKSGTLSAADGAVLTITTSAADAAGTFRHGWIEVGSGASWEIRSIISSQPVSGGQELTIDWPLRQIPSGQDATFYRGCDLTATTCKALGNFARFRGHPNVPLFNLSLPTMQPPTPGGGKK